MANNQIYLQLDGIQGGCQQSGHTDWIRLESFTFSVDHDRNVTEANPGSEEVQIGALNCVVLSGTQTPQLIKKCYDHGGGPIGFGVLECCQDEKCYLKLDLTNVWVTQCVTSASSETPVDSLVLVPEILKITHVDTSHAAGWDLVKGEEAA